MRRLLALGLAVAALLAGGTSGAAAPREVTGSYTAEAPLPEPLTQTTSRRGLCDPALTAAKHETRFRAPFPGRLTVTLDRFAGDWALGVFDPDGHAYATSDQVVGEAALDLPEQVRVLLRRPGTVVVLRACNLAGGPTGRVSYVFRGL